MIQALNFAHMLFSPYRNIFSAWPPGSRPLFKMAAILQEHCCWQLKFAIHILCMCKLYFCCIKYVIQLHWFHYFLFFTKNNLYNRTKYKKSDLFCTISAHWYKSLPIISAWGSLSAFLQSAPK
jgi:hypothetical protein